MGVGWKGRRNLRERARERNGELVRLAPTLITILATIAIALGGVGLYEMRSRVRAGELVQARHAVTPWHAETGRAIIKIETQVGAMQVEQERQAGQLEKLRTQQHSDTERIIGEIRRSQR